MPALTRPQKITFGEMRAAAGVRGVLLYCADYTFSHSIALSGDRWPDCVRLSDLEMRFVCKASGKKGAEVRPGFLVAAMGINDGEGCLRSMVGMGRKAA